MKLLWKCLPEDQRPNGHDWTIPGWHHRDGEIVLCENGFHASDEPSQAMGYVKPGYFCRVEVKGECAKQSDKSAWSDMRIVRKYHWTKEKSVKLAIYAAELALPTFEQQHQGDTLPRNAIEAAKKWLENPTEENRLVADAAAHAAYAADCVAYAADYAAARAAYAAANAAADAAANAAADAAANAADYAAYAAAYAADCVAYAADYAADYAAYAAATIKKINSYIKKLMREK